MWQPENEQPSLMTHQKWVICTYTIPNRIFILEFHIYGINISRVLVPCMLQTIYQVWMFCDFSSSNAAKPQLTITFPIRHASHETYGQKRRFDSGWPVVPNSAKVAHQYTRSISWRYVFIVRRVFLLHNLSTLILKIAGYLRVINRSSDRINNPPGSARYLLSGWWLSLPLWKMMEWKSVGMMTFPIYGK